MIRSNNRKARQALKDLPARWPHISPQIAKFHQGPLGIGRMVHLLLFVLGLVGCGPARVTAPPVTEAGFPRTVTDDLGRRVTFRRPARRIVSIAPGHTESLYALGLGDRVVAADRYSDTPPEVRPKAILNTWPRPPLERLVALNPDLVLALTEGEETVQEMEAAGLRVLKLNPRSYSEVVREIRLLGAISSTEVAAERLASAMERRAATIVSCVSARPKPRVLYEIDASDPARPYVVASGDFMADVLELAGGANLFAKSPGIAAQVSLEQVLARDPEVILVSDAAHAAQLLSRPGWRTTTAVRQRRVHAIGGHQFTRPGPRLAEALEAVARALHPGSLEQ